MFATLVHGRQHDHKVSTVCIEKQPQRQRQVVRVPDWVEHNRSQVLRSRWIDQLSFHLFHKNQFMSPLFHNVKRNWHLICSPPDFSGKVSLNLPLGLDTSCCGVQTAWWRPACCWLKWVSLNKCVHSSVGVVFLKKHEIEFSLIIIFPDSQRSSSHIPTYIAAYMKFSNMYSSCILKKYIIFYFLLFHSLIIVSLSQSQCLCSSSFSSSIQSINVVVVFYLCLSLFSILCTFFSLIFFNLPT